MGAWLSTTILIRKLTMLIVVTYLCFTINTIYAQAPERGINEYTPQELVHYFALKYGVSEYQLSVVIKCESGFNPKAIGDKGKSLGLAQIHLPAHPDISREQAFDTVFAIEYMAKEFKAGHQRMWTCWRVKFGV